MEELFHFSDCFNVEARNSHPSVGVRKKITDCWLKAKHMICFLDLQTMKAVCLNVDNV